MARTPIASHHIRPECIPPPPQQSRWDSIGDATIIGPIPPW